MEEIKLPQKYTLLKQNLRSTLEKEFGEEAYMLERLLLEDFEEKGTTTPIHDLSETDRELLEERVNRLIQGEPIQYILEKGHFYGRDFYLTPDVLIPRRETEELMVWVREAAGETRKSGPLFMLDIGSGSGCISISLDLELRQLGKEVMVWGMDKSEEAIEVANQNAQLFESSCQFFEGDILLLTPNDLGKWDFIVSNPPYIPLSEKEELAPKVKDHEPEIALYVPDKDPLRYYKKIMSLAKECLNPGGQLFFEIHENFGKEIVSMLKEAGFRMVQLRQDMQGKDRMIQAYT